MTDAIPPTLAARIAADPRLEDSPRLHYHAEVGSTNDVAMALAAEGAVEGTAVLAAAQRSGRGRQGRAWFSPPGAGLYLSVVARPPADAAGLVSLGAGAALARAVLAATGLPVELKWPNDLVVGRPWRKLAGVLSEASGVAGRIDSIVVGLGLNLRAAAYPSELAGCATSLEVELGREIDAEAVVVELMAEMRSCLARLRRLELGWVRQEWLRFGRAGLGGTVRWREGAMDHRGVAVDIADDGALLVEHAGGRRRLVAGEVTWERMS